MRKIIAITGAQAAWMRKEAARLGVSETEVIRRLIDRELGNLYADMPPLRPHPQRTPADPGRE
jgi:hypothetical protein